MQVPELAALDWWIIKQLRALVLTDLREFVPDGYFSREMEGLKNLETLANSEHYSSEIRWGYLAGTLGQKLFFRSDVIMSARQTSAAELLMNLGMLASAEAAQGVSQELSSEAKTKGAHDGNIGQLAVQLRSEHIPTFTANIRSALSQYLCYLTSAEAKPFLTLLESPNLRKNSMFSSSQQSIVINGSVGVIQAGSNSVVNLKQQNDRDFSSLVDALAQLRQSASSTNEITEAQNAGIQAAIQGVVAAIKRGEEDGVNLSKSLSGVSSIVQTIGSLQPAWETVRTMARLVGLSL